MATATEHGKTALSAVFYGGGSLGALDYLRSRLAEEHFEDVVQRALFRLACNYADQCRGIIPKAVLADALRGQPPGRALQVAEYYDLLAEHCPEGHEFKFSVLQLRDLAAERATGDALHQGMEILRGGVRDDQDNLIQGHKSAREHVLEAFAAAERLNSGGESPQGDVRAEGAGILARYARAKELRVSGSASGVAFGIEELDHRLPAGVMPGSLNIVLGWTSAGKTSFCVNWAWHAAVSQGRDVVYFTTETLRPQVTAKLLSRHSRLERFGLSRGLDSNDILAGTLDAAGEAALNAVLSDFTAPKSGYGRINVVQTPRAATVGTIEAMLASIDRQYRPAICFMDYLQLLDPHRRRRDSSQSEDLSGIVKEAGQVAGTFADGAGIPFVSPWQVTREGRKNARTSGGYSLLDTGGTKEAADSADLVLSLMDPEKDTSGGLSVPIDLTVLKNRAGRRNITVQLRADFATCCYTPADRITSNDSVLSMGAT